MRSIATVALLVTVLGSIALGGPEQPRRLEASAPPAGFSRRLVADTLPATLPRERETSTVFATVKITAEVGEDE